MKHVIDRIKQYWFLLVAALCLLLTLLLSLWDRSYAGQLTSENLVERWNAEEDYQQVSVYFPTGQGLSEEEIQTLTTGLNTALAEASIDTTEGEGRKLVTACSAKSEAYLSSDTASITARCYGVSKDFFLFHPIDLVSGSYITDSDPDDCGIVIDEYVAWQLYGAIDVAGMSVNFEGEEYTIRGVVRSEEGYFSEAAGETTPTVYVDYALLDSDASYSDGEDWSDSDSYSDLTFENLEVLVISPVDDFGEDTVSQVLETSLGRTAENYILVTDSSRFTLANRLARYKEIGTRAMSSQDVIYPYWENRARAYEEVLQITLTIEILLMIYPCVLGLYWLIRGIRYLDRRCKAWIAKKRTHVQP